MQQTVIRLVIHADVETERDSVLGVGEVGKVLAALLDEEEVAQKGGLEKLGLTKTGDHFTGAVTRGRLFQEVQGVTDEIGKTLIVLARYLVVFLS